MRVPIAYEEDSYRSYGEVFAMGDGGVLGGR